MLEIVNLPRLMSATRGRPAIAVALIDGPVNTSLPEFAASVITNISSGKSGSCDQVTSAACVHGTLVAGVLIGLRESTPAICPGCTLLVRPIFGEKCLEQEGLPLSSPEDLAAAMIESVMAGARIINLSCGVSRCSVDGARILNAALGLAASKGVIVAAAAGNQSTVGGSCITQHPWVIPVISIDAGRRPTHESNLSAGMGQRGLGAPGQGITSVSSDGRLSYFSGTSAACAFVSGAAALLCSEYPNVSGAHIRHALTSGNRNRTIVPPAMDAWAAFERLNAPADRRKLA